MEDEAAAAGSPSPSPPVGVEGGQDGGVAAWQSRQSYYLPRRQQQQDPVALSDRYAGGTGRSVSPPMIPVVDDAAAAHSRHRPPIQIQPAILMPPPIQIQPAILMLYEYDDQDAAGPSSNKRACIPASTKAILGLKQVAVLTTDDDDDCAICLKALADQDTDDDDARLLRAMPCSHVFHQHCIFQWLRRNAVCPLCRHKLPTTDEDDDDDDDDQYYNNPADYQPWLRTY